MSSTKNNTRPRANITIHDVAEKAGVSFSTAAAALRGNARVAKSTAERVRKAAAALHYRRSEAASALASRRHPDSPKTFSICLLHFGDGAVKASVAQLMQDESERTGLIFSTRSTPEGVASEAVARELEARGVEGLIRVQSGNPKGKMILPWERFCVVSIHRDHLEDGFDVIRQNDFYSTVSLLRKAKEMGYRRFGVWLAEQDEPTIDDQSRLAGALLFREQQPDCKVSIKRRKFSETNERGFPEIARQMKAWLGKEKPEVMIGFNATDYHLLKTAGFTIPDEIAFAQLHTFDDELGLAGNQAFHSTAPAAAVRLLLTKLRAGERGLSPTPRETVLTPRFISGWTLPEKHGRPGRPNATPRKR